MRQRLGIAAVMLGDPPVLMFDEPFNGMDPEGIVWMRGFQTALAGEGCAVLVSSHLMAELHTPDRPLAGPGRARRVGRRSPAGRRPAAPRPRRVTCTAHRRALCRHRKQNPPSKRKETLCT
jgi:ABC-2 type transport system ATP-binding protein